MKKMLETIKTFFVLLIFIFVLRVRSSSEECYANQTDPYVLFSTKTGYFQVDNEDSNEIKFPGCEAKSFWLLARHGTRNPGADDIILMDTRLKEIQALIIENHNAGLLGDLCEPDFEGIRDWNFDLTVEDEGQLTDSGKLEHFSLGQRFKSRLPSIIGQNYDPNLFQIRHTFKNRTGDSGRAFVEGAFPQDVIEFPPPPAEDKLLRFFQYCPLWTTEVDESEETLKEQNLFGNSSYMLEVIHKANTKLGFVDFELNLSDISLIYDMCRYEKAWNPDELSVWCAVFEQTDIEVLEYYEDLQYWYTNGYYNPLNYKMACPLMADLVKNFQGDDPDSDEDSSSKTEDSNDILNGTFYFTHSEAVLPFVALMGLYKDSEVPRHDNFEEMRKRNFRTSTIGPFTNNFALVLFDCEGTKKVLAIHQETPVELELCGDLLCDWDLFQDIYKEDINCNFDEMCNNDIL